MWKYSPSIPFEGADVMGEGETTVNTTYYGTYSPNCTPPWITQMWILIIQGRGCNWMNSNPTLETEIKIWRQPERKRGGPLLLALLIPSFIPSAVWVRITSYCKKSHRFCPTQTFIFVLSLRPTSPAAVLLAPKLRQTARSHSSFLFSILLKVLFS